MHLPMLLVALLSLAVAVARAAIPNGETLSLDGIPYYHSGIPVSLLNTQFSWADTVTEGINAIPLTVIPVGPTTNISSVLVSFYQRDDVFQSGFLRIVYLSREESVSRASLQQHAAELQSAGTQILLAGPGVASAPHQAATLRDELPPGPYFVSRATGAVFRAYRVYPDDNLAFIQASFSDEQGGVLPLPAVTENAMTKDVAVPSRLYYQPTKDQPLAGLRLGVKDIFHVRGLRTSGGSRSYYYLYGPQNATAPSVQRLLDLGAVLVGKMGTVQFANGDRPTADWVDFHCPFNPRGDGYQSPGGSSSGPGAGVASYDWLDLAVGSDTGGSMRSPASVQGIYGNRPSTGAISLDHVLPLSPALDTAGVFARSPHLWAQAVQAWYPHARQNYTTFPRQLILTGGGWDGANVSNEAHELVESFVRRLEAFLGASRTLIDVDQHWRQTRPATSPGLNEMFNLTYGILTSVDQFHDLATPLLADYAAAHDGRHAFINPGPLARWQWGQHHGGQAAAAEGRRNVTTFRKWWETSGYGRADEASCSESLVASIYSSATTDYRNQYYDGPTAPPTGFHVGRIASYAATPEVVVPVGEAPYHSTVSRKTEYLPVTVALQMGRGCDHALAAVVAALGDKGELRGVNTGSRL